MRLRQPTRRREACRFRRRLAGRLLACGAAVAALAAIPPTQARAVPGAVAPAGRGAGSPTGRDAAVVPAPAVPAAGRPAQDAPATGPAAGPGQAAGARPLPPVEAPPELPAFKLQALDREIQKLRNSKAEVRARTEDAVVAFGRGAIPSLVKASSSTHAGQMDGLVSTLARLADLRDRDLVEQSFASERVVMRRFAARKAGEYGLPALVERIVPLLSDPDGTVREEAALGLVRAGRDEGLPLAAALYVGAQRERVLDALPGVVGKGAHEPLAALLVIDPQREKEEPDVAAAERQSAVELLHAIGDEASRALLVRALDDKHNVVQRKAIDALRDLLEDQGPMQASSIFQQIKEVERLKAAWNNRPREG